LAGFASALLAFLPGVQAQADRAAPEPVSDQVVVLFSGPVVELPDPSSRVAPSAATMPSALRAALDQSAAREVRRGMPDFVSADTSRALSGGRVLRLPDFSNLFVVSLPKGASSADRDSLIARLERLPYVEYAEPNQVASPRTRPIPPGPITEHLMAEDQPALIAFMGEVIPTNEPSFSSQWGLKNTAGGSDINATFAWDVTKGSSSTIIGVVDSPIDAQHPDLAGKVTGSTGTGNTTVDFHGTMVAGVAAARGQNQGGYVVGVDWNAKIHSEPLADLPTTAGSISDAVLAGARVINNSWGTAQTSSTLTAALRSAYEADVALVHANPYELSPDPNLTSDYPNNVGPWIINVGAMGRYAYGPCCNTKGTTYTDVGAPGEAITSTLAYGATYTDPGSTSFATPFVTGTAGLLLAAQPGLYSYDIEHLLKRTAQGLTSGGQAAKIGSGMIDADAAVRAVGGTNTLRHGDATFTKIFDNKKSTFANSPGNGLAAGVYYADVYRMRAQDTRSYPSTPMFWLPPTEHGISAANPNSGARYYSESNTASSRTAETYFWFVRTTSGGSTVNRWVPFDPTPFKRNGAYAYTVIGDPGPLAASIAGPSSVVSNQQNTWSTSPTGGSPPYSYQWEYYYVCSGGGGGCTGTVCPMSGPTCGTWYNHGTSNSMTRSFSGAAEAKIRLTVTDAASGSVSQTRSIAITSGATAGDGSSREQGDTGAEAALRAVTEYQLHALAPNPIARGGEFHVRYDLPEAARVRISVYDVLGREVAVLSDDAEAAGQKSLSLSESALLPGLYVVRLQAEGASGPFAATKRFTVVE
jgi:subtilisin family serine protease